MRKIWLYSKDGLFASSGLCVKRNHIERSHQIAFIDWCRLHPILKEIAYHPANGGSRNIIEARTLKRMGVLKGVSDVHIPYPTAFYHGLYLEFKPSKKSYLSKEQKRWIELMLKYGHWAQAVYSCDEAINVTCNYLSSKGDY